MDQHGSIHHVPDDEPALAQFRQKLESLGVQQGDLEPIPAEQLSKVKRMNRKARRKWYAKQRRK